MRPMSLFEFQMALAAVAIAIGITEIVGGWGRLLRSDISVRVDWIHLLWSLNIVLLSLYYWTGMWRYNATEFAYVGQVYMLVIPTLLLVLASYAITPEVPADRTLDLREYYMANRKKVFIPLAAFMLSAYVADLVILGVGVWEWTLLISATSAT